METSTVVLLTAVGVIAVTYALALGRMLYRDGPGHRNPPRSHREWWESMLVAKGPAARRGAPRATGDRGPVLFPLDDEADRSRHEARHSNLADR